MRVVVVGGGTGNSTVLSGLSPYVGEGLTAVVNTFDDGGATGNLRNYYLDLLAVGDLRQCLEALSQAPEDQRALFNSRFALGSGEANLNLHGQSMGNLIIARAMQEYTDPSVALRLVGRIYDIKGRVLPASDDNRRLEFRLPNGRVIHGEYNAEEDNAPSLKGAVIGFDKNPTDISEETEAAIANAELVVLAPGDLYTSLAPVLAVGRMKEAMRKAGKVVMVSNLMNRNRHTVGFNAVDYVREYERILGINDGERVIDAVIFNTHPPKQAALKIQAELGSRPVEATVEMLESAGYHAVGMPLLSSEEVIFDANDAIAHTRSTIRHDPDKVARAIMGEYFSNSLAKR